MMGFALTSVSAKEVRVAVPGGPTVAGLALMESATPKPTQVLHLNFVLKSARKAGIQAFLDAQRKNNSPLNHKRLTPDEFGKMFGASDADVQAVAAFATAQGFKITHLWENRLFIAADATVAQVEKAFGTTILGYQRPAHLIEKGDETTFYAPSGPVTLPAAIASRVDNVIGLDNMLKMRAHAGHKQVAKSQEPLPVPFKTPPPPGMTANFSGPMAPADVSTFYGVNPLHNANVYGYNQNIAIISPTSYNFQNNIDFGNYWGLSGWTVWWEDFDGGPQDSNGQIEACLDTETIIGQAPSSTIWVFQFPNNLADFIDGYNLIASSSFQGSGTANIQVVSQSWGIDESTLHSNGLDYIAGDYNTALSALRAVGVAFYNSSGDTGGIVISPSSDPNATAVGGTDNLQDDSNGNWVSEQGWNGSGGGNSIYFGTPSWQSGPGVSNGYSNGTRQVPDVSGDGGPNPGYWVRANDSSGNPAWYQVWGTSASAPLWAAINLLLDQETYNLYGDNQWHSGSLNSELYWIGTNLNDYRYVYNGAYVFRDVTVAESGSPYPCTDAWDYVTGWGSASAWKLWTDYVEYWGGPGYTAYNGANGSISITDAAGTPTTYDSSTTYYINAPYGCSGPADAPVGTLDVNIDGTDNYFGMGTLPVGYYYPNGDLITTGFSVGSHTITQSITLGTPNWSNTITLSSVTIKVLPALSSLTVSPTSVYGSQSSIGTVTLGAKAPAGGAIVALSSSNSAAKVPATVKVAAGSTTGKFTITTSTVSSNVTATISATYNGETSNANLTVKTNAISGFTISPTSVVGGASATGTVTLGLAASANVTVKFASTGGTTIPAPASITIKKGAKTGTVTIKTAKTTKTVTATITATALGSSKTAKLSAIK
jgi:kumamolisin